MTNILKYAGIVALVLSAIVTAKVFLPAQVSSFGTVGGMLIEQYDPYVRYNGGVNSALPIQTSNTITSAGATNSGITTLTKATFCINFYATSTATQLHMVASTTATLPNGAAAVLTANYGACS